MHRKLQAVNFMGQNHMNDLDKDKKVILKLNLKKQDVRMLTRPTASW